jgi:alpha-L-fucosidase
MDIYLNSVGKNGVLLLNIPPDRRGLLHEADVAALKAWKARRDEAFGTNLAAAGRITDALGKRINGLTDGKLKTDHTIDASLANNTIEISWKKAVTLSSLMLMENIGKGQRVEGFAVEVRAGKGWIKAAEGTTIGYKRILLLKSISTTAVRIRITGSRLETNLAEIGIY